MNMRSTRTSCPISTAISGYHLSSGSIMKLARMNWRMSLLNIIAYGGGSMHYNDIYKASGLNPRTMSLALRDLTDSGMVVRTVEHGPSIRVSYSITAAGRQICNSACPLLDISAGRNRAKRVAFNNRL